MTIAARSGPSPADMLAVPRIPIIGRRVVAALFLWSGGIHVGLLSADPEIYRRFADRALFPFVRDGWAEVFMAQPRAWALALAFAETVTGILLLTRGRAVAAGWAAVIVFHVLLLLFGFGFWLWAVPALVVVTGLARADRSEWVDHGVDVVVESADLTRPMARADGGLGR